jgi:glycosyltransferase involved in cell wall biosynthesis
MRKPLYGNIICQNGVAEILRAIESIARICDKIYVMDGGSTDGTLESTQKFPKSLQS